MFDYTFLRKRTKERGLALYELAEACGISQPAMSRKLCGKVGFTAKDILRISRVLGLTKAEIGPAFYTEKGEA